MSTLLEKAKALPKGSESLSKWKAKYEKIFFLLVDEKEKNGVEAVRWIANEEGLTTRQEKSLYRCAMYWKQTRDDSRKDNA